jgi:hypothetical protein
VCGNSKLSADTSLALCPLWVKNRQTVPGQNLTLSAIVRKRTNPSAVGLSAKCQKQNSDRHSTYTIVGFARARWISRMSPWCTVAT